MAIYFFGLSFGQLIYGPISDRIGRRKPLLFGCSLYALASLGCALAPTMESLIFFRLLQSLGGSVGMVTTLSIVRDVFEVRESARILSSLILVMGAAPILAPLLGGQILLYSDWRIIFVLLSGFGLLCVALVALGLPESHPPGRRNQSPLSSVFGDYARLLSDLRFLRYALPNSLMGAGFFAYLASASLVFIGVYQVSLQNFGWIFGLNALGLIGASQLNNHLLRRYSSAQILVAAMAVLVLAALGLVLVAVLGLGGMWGIWLGLLVCVGGMGLIRPNAQAIAMAPYPERAGLASSLLAALGSGVGSLAGVALSFFQVPSALPMALTIAAAYTLGLLVFWGIRRWVPASEAHP
jgi:DHA1 family bicyclomycin/chloramphenicol resistance-like MFS transporter